MFHWLPKYKYSKDISWSNWHNISCRTQGKSCDSAELIKQCKFNSMIKMHLAIVTISRSSSLLSFWIYLSTNNPNESNIRSIYSLSHNISKSVIYKVESTFLRFSLYIIMLKYYFPYYDIHNILFLEINIGFKHFLLFFK